MYQKIKKQNGEKFAQVIRNFHNGIFEIPEIDVMLRHAGRDAEDAEKLLPYLMTLLTTNDDAPPPEPQNPFDLLEQAGYDAFTADTLEKQNSIKKYFQPGELLCTFNDASRHEKYHIVHAVKKDVRQIRREDFKGKEKREDEYGTSVISIQMLKSGGFISIKNRYNHAVNNCDNTFNSNPDNIIEGLSVSLKDHFNVEFTITESPLPANFLLVGEQKQIFKYHHEINNVYYGDQAWVQNGEIHVIDKSAGDALFDYFRFDNKTKTLIKLDPNYEDSFADDFNRAYGGNKALIVKNGNLMLGEDVLIGAENSRIKTLDLPELAEMGHYCLCNARALTELNVPALTAMGAWCLQNIDSLTMFNAPALTTMGSHCLCNAYALTTLNAPLLGKIPDDIRKTLRKNNPSRIRAGMRRRMGFLSRR